MQPVNLKRAGVAFCLDAFDESPLNPAATKML